MKRFALLCIALAAFAALSLPAHAAPAKPSHPEAPAPAGWDQLKSLVGNWVAKGPDGKSINVSYKLISNGSALMETGMHDMITIYHPDGKRLMLTHYCAEKNQPRMATEAGKASAGRLDFHLVDVTNLASPDAGFMNHLVLSFLDKNHITAEWGHKAKGKMATYTFKFERRK